MMCIMVWFCVTCYDDMHHVITRISGRYAPKTLAIVCAQGLASLSSNMMHAVADPEGVGTLDIHMDRKIKF